jgi:glycosyltransferase involved in cell wall biosynthesis
MNICMLVYSYPPLSVGGAERQCRLQACELVRQGHTCTVLTARSRWSLPRHEEEMGVHVRRVAVTQPFINVILEIKSRLFHKPENSVKVRSSVPHSERQKQHLPVSALERWVSKWNAATFMRNACWYIWSHRREIDVVHTHVASWNAGFVAWLGSRLGIPVVCKAANLPAFDDFRSQVPFASFWEKWRLRCNYFALTDAMQANLMGEGVQENQIRVLPNGVPLSGQGSKVGASKQVIFVGNFTQGVGHKSFDILLKAWAIASKDFPDWKLFMAGGGDTGPWESLAAELKCRSSVEFGGRISNLSESYAASAVFILVSRIEGISNALLEAQSHGLPAVVSDIPGNRAVVVQAKTGFLVPHGDEVRTAEALSELMKDPLLRESMGGNASVRIRENFDLSKVVHQLLTFYGELTQRGFTK